MSRQQRQRFFQDDFSRNFRAQMEAQEPSALVQRPLLNGVLKIEGKEIETAEQLRDAMVLLRNVLNQELGRLESNHQQFRNSLGVVQGMGAAVDRLCALHAAYLDQLEGR